MLKNTNQNFGVLAKIFHWAFFLLLTFSIIAGNFLADMPKGAEKLEGIGMHKAFGSLILMLLMMRLFWRLINVMPSLPSTTTTKQALMARAMHWVLYFLMFAQPLSGVMMSQSSGYPVSFFGLFEFPMFLDKNTALAENFHTAHGLIWMALVIAVLGHVAAALQHHFILKDDVLKKMTFSSNA